MQTKQLSSFNWTTDRSRATWYLVDSEVSEGLRTEGRFGLIKVDRVRPLHMGNTEVYSVDVDGHSVAHFLLLREAKADAESRALDRIIDFEEHAEPRQQRRRYSIRVGLRVAAYGVHDVRTHKLVHCLADLRSNLSLCGKEVTPTDDGPSAFADYGPPASHCPRCQNVFDGSAERFPTPAPAPSPAELAATAADPAPQLPAWRLAETVRTTAKQLDLLAQQLDLFVAYLPGQES